MPPKKTTSTPGDDLGEVKATPTAPAAPTEGVPPETPADDVPEVSAAAPAKGKGKGKASVEPEEPPKDRFGALMDGALGKAYRGKYGKNSFLPASKNPVLLHRRFLSTDLFPLDVALGGGVPIGMWSTFFGAESSGKSTLCTKIVAEAQRRCSVCYQRQKRCECAGGPTEFVCAYLDVEGSYDLEWARGMGVNADRLAFSQPSSGEEALEALESLLRSGLCDLAILDSIAMLQPKGGLDRDMGDGVPGSQARLVGEGVRRVTAALNEQGNKTGRRPTILAVNQTRMKIGVMFGNPETQSGGNAPLFVAGSIVRTTKGKVITDKDETGAEMPLYAEAGFTVVKSKRTAPRQSGEYRLYLTDTQYKPKGHTSDEHILTAEAERLGYLTGSGNSWTLFDEKYLGKSKVTERLLKEPDFRERVYEALLLACV